MTSLSSFYISLARGVSGFSQNSVLYDLTKIECKHFTFVGEFSFLQISVMGVTGLVSLIFLYISSLAYVNSFAHKAPKITWLTF